MTVDVLLETIDENFLDEIDEIMEDTMVQLFIVHPKDEEALSEIQEHALEHPSLFYAAPLSLKARCDANCVAYQVDDTTLLDSDIDKPVFIDASLLDEATQQRLADSTLQGIITSAKHSYPALKGFSTAISAGSFETFDKACLETTPMEKLVFHSSYPAHDFESIMHTAKNISDVMFRPEQSIIANATKTALILFGFKK